MKNSKSLADVIKHSATYSLGNLSTKLIGFILLPFYTSYLTTNQYGMLALLEITGQILVSVFSLNLATGMMRWISDEKVKKEENSIVFTILIATLIIGMILIVLLKPFSDYLSKIIFDTSEFEHYFELLFISSAINVYNLVPLTLLRHHEKSIHFAVLTTFKFALTLIAIIFFITKLDLGIEGILYGQIIGQSFLAVFTIQFVYKNIHPKINIHYFIEIIKYSLPLVLSGIFTLILTMSDRYLIKYFYDNSSVGIYSLGHKLASIMNVFIIQSFQLGFLPIAYKKLNDVDAKQFFSKILNYYAIVLVFSALGISMFSKEVLVVLAKNKEYWDAYYVVPILSLGFVIKGFHYLFSLSFHYTKKTIYNAYIVILASLLNIIMNLILLPNFNYIGAAISIVISFLFMAIMAYLLGQKVYKINYEFKKVFSIVFYGFIIYLSSFIFNNLGLISNVLVKLSLILLYLFILYITGILTKTDILNIKKLIPTIKRI